MWTHRKTKRQRISLIVLVLTHLINLTCAGFNQVIQFSFFLNEIRYFQRQGTALSSSVQKKKTEQKHRFILILSEKFKIKLQIGTIILKMKN